MPLHEWMPRELFTSQLVSYRLENNVKSHLASFITARAFDGCAAPSSWLLDVSGNRARGKLRAGLCSGTAAAAAFRPIWETDMPSEKFLATGKFGIATWSSAAAACLWLLYAVSIMIVGIWACRLSVMIVGIRACRAQAF